MAKDTTEMNSKAPEPTGDLHTPAMVGDKTGWGGSKDAGVKGTAKNMQSAGYDTSNEEAKGHKQG